MIEICINTDYGGFGLSKKAYERYQELGGTLEDHELRQVENRGNSLLIQVVKELGDKAAGDFADLLIVDIPGVEYKIDEYDGMETINYPEANQYWHLVDTPEARDKFPEKFL